ncbi:MAG: hypothetical protein ACJ8AW_01700, partial [Rhodopila sp.]
TQATVTAFASDAGHSTAVANDISEALEVPASDREVDLLIADSSLAGLSSAQLIAQAQQHRPGLPALLVSATGGATMRGQVETLAKPFSKDAFDRAISSALRAASSAQIIPLRRSCAS